MLLPFPKATRVTLIDTGAANVWQNTLGYLPEAIREAGVSREAIETVAFTHTHLDHINGPDYARLVCCFPPIEPHPRAEK